MNANPNAEIYGRWKPENVIYEIAVKEGFSLTSRVEKIAAVKSNKVFSVTDEEKNNHSAFVWTMK